MLNRIINNSIRHTSIMQTCRFNNVAVDRNMSTTKVSDSTKRKNAVTALLLLGFVVAVYNISISKMKSKVLLNFSYHFIKLTIAY
jgi:hypothetical protein